MICKELMVNAELGQNPFPENTLVAVPPSISQQLQLAASEQQ